MWERGVREPKVSTLLKIAEVTGVGPLFFLGPSRRLSAEDQVPGSSLPGRPAELVVREPQADYDWLLEAMARDARLEPAIRELIDVLSEPVDNPDDNPAKWLLGNIRTFAAVARSHPRRKRKPALG